LDFNHSEQKKIIIIYMWVIGVTKYIKILFKVNLLENLRLKKKNKVTQIIRKY